MHDQYPFIYKYYPNILQTTTSKSLSLMNTTKQLHSCDQDQTLEMHTKPKVEKERDYIGDDHDEADEDILSLCDLQVNCKNNQISHHLDHDQKIDSNKIESHETSSLRLKSSPSSENQENLFEFFSEEWNVTNTTTTSPKITICKPVIPTLDQDDDENVIFRPKNISYSKPPNPKTKNVVTRITPQHKRSNSTRMVSSKSNHSIFTKSKSYSSVTSKSVEDHSKVSASPVKSKLLLVLFGLPPKIPTDQTMNDIKIRQSRHAPSTFFPSSISRGGGCIDDQEAVPLGRRRSENRMWRFIKAVTCFRSQHRENMSFDV